MKAPKLYIKFFLFFTFMLAVTLLMIFGLYRVTEERARRNMFSQQVRQYTFNRVMFLTELLREKITQEPAEKNLTEAVSIDVQSFINSVGKLNSARVWLSNSDGVFMKSLDCEVPDNLDDLPLEKKYLHDGMTLYQDFRGTREIYVISPIESVEQEGITFHILFNERRGPERQEAGFTVGLVGIGIIIPLLVIPISRFISGRVNRLKQSALRIASGDLSHRINEKGHDEIGELGKAFNQMADKVERMVVGGKALTALVSHELRTPLTRIRIAEEIVREKLENENLDSYLRHLDDIREDINLLNNLIGRILEFSKIDMHEDSLEMESLDIKALIADLIHQLKPIIDRKNLNVYTALPLIPGFKGNSVSLSTAILNIIDNAVKYTESGKNIYVSLLQEGDYVVLSVVNNYKKLEKSDFDRIFEPFQRVGDSGTTGSGLGLAIAQKIIERHGGSVMASNAEKGFEIRIELPLSGR